MNVLVKLTAVVTISLVTDGPTSLCSAGNLSSSFSYLSLHSLRFVSTVWPLLERFSFGEGGFKMLSQSCLNLSKPERISFILDSIKFCFLGDSCRIAGDPLCVDVVFLFALRIL